MKESLVLLLFEGVCQIQNHTFRDLDSLQSCAVVDKLKKLPHFSQWCQFIINTRIGLHVLHTSLLFYTPMYNNFLPPLKRSFSWYPISSPQQLRTYNPSIQLDFDGILNSYIIQLSNAYNTMYFFEWWSNLKRSSYNQ